MKRKDGSTLRASIRSRYPVTPSKNTAANTIRDPCRKIQHSGCRATGGHNAGTSGALANTRTASGDLPGSTEVPPQHVRQRDRTVGVLVVLHHRDQRAADRDT